MQKILVGLTPAELPAHEQSHEQNNEFARTINISSGQLSGFSKNFFYVLSRCRKTSSATALATPAQLMDVIRPHRLGRAGDFASVRLASAGAAGKELEA